MHSSRIEIEFTFLFLILFFQMKFFFRSDVHFYTGSILFYLYIILGTDRRAIIVFLWFGKNLRLYNSRRRTSKIIIKKIQEMTRRSFLTKQFFYTVTKLLLRYSRPKNFGLRKLKIKWLPR